MACPICGARCKCKKAGEGGLCCACHRHKAQRGFTRMQLDDWRVAHRLDRVSDFEWRTKFADDHGTTVK